MTTNSSNAPLLAGDIPLNSFLLGVNEMTKRYWINSKFTFNSAPEVRVISVGRKYAKLAACEQSPPFTGPYLPTRVYCFYEPATGNLVKGTWKAPIANGVRGNVHEANALSKFGEYGPKGLR